jgi:tRNA nucleotidyltransferase (CCA-adding enzyme)
MAAIGEELFPYLMQVQYADAIAQSDYIKEETLQRIMRVWEVSREILRDGECISLSQLAITGKDLIAIGYRQGPGIGKTLHQALDAVLDEPEKNDREFLLLIARQMLRTELQDSGDRA